MIANARAPADDDVPSPCISVCTLDATQSHCLGCGRTLHEIATWVEMSNVEKRAVVASLPSRGIRVKTP